jgi:hypothetical protein
MLLITRFSAASRAEAEALPISVSLPSFALGRTETVVGFECKVTRGYISRAKAPDQWTLSVENGEQGVATISAAVLMGQAAFTNTDLGYFNDFIVVQRSTNLVVYPRPFDILVEVQVSTDVQLKKYRTIRCRMKDLRLRPQ